MDFSSFNPNTSNILNLAARQNDVKSVERLLKKRNPNCIDNRGWTCLHEAAANDSFESLILILEHHETRPLAETHEGHTALYLACHFHSSIRTVKALLDNVEDIANYGSLEGFTPLHIASEQGNSELVQLLISYGAMLDVQDFDGDTPLHSACMNKSNDNPESSLTTVAILLHAGADAEIVNDTKCTPFHIACYRGHYGAIKKLFDFVSNINKLTINGDSPLILAAKALDNDVVNFLLKHGADPHIRNADDDSALEMALSVGGSDVFKALLLATDKDKINPEIILYACKPHYFKFDILAVLLEYDLGPDFFDFIEPFHVILEKMGDIQPVYLTSSPLNSYLNICEYIYENSPEYFERFFYVFLSNGVDVNAINKDECPPLVYIHYCVHEPCFQEVFRILIEHGCNVDYCTTESKFYCIPDAFMASLTSDATTAPIMLPYSLLMEPENLLKFACENGVLYRIPHQVQDQILSMIDKTILEEGVTAEYLSYHVPSLKHVTRLKVRQILRGIGVNTTKQFHSVISKLCLPKILIDYICYLN